MNFSETLYDDRELWVNNRNSEYLKKVLVNPRMGHFTQIRVQQISSLYSRINTESLGVERHCFERHSFDIVNASKKHKKWNIFIKDLVTFTEEILNEELHFLCSKKDRWKPIGRQHMGPTFYVLFTADVTKQILKVLFNVKHVWSYYYVFLMVLWH